MSTVAQKALSEYMSMLADLTLVLEYYGDVQRGRNRTAIGVAQGKAQVYQENFYRHNKELGRLLREMASNIEYDGI